MPELCLGTVQFGMKYGINNQIGRQPTRDESFEMLDYAIDHGIDTIDTACAYGEAEEIIGDYVRACGKKHNIKVISKLRPNVIDGRKPAEKIVAEECKNSLRRLSMEQLDGYLLHTPEYIYHEEILAALVGLKKEGYVKNIGVSIYDLKEGYAAIDTGVVDYIQLPYSILDQRGIKEGFISAAKRAGIKIFTRSAFLQGLFIMETGLVPKHLQNAVPYLEKIENVLEQYEADKISAILQFVKQERQIDYLVFGVEKLEQLEEDIRKADQANVPEECLQQLKKEINNVAQAIIFPSLWADGKKG